MVRNQFGRLRVTAFVSFFLLPIFAGCSENNPVANASDPAVAERTAPVGQVAVEGADADAFETVTAASTVVAAAEGETPAAAADHPGKKTYDEACSVCHGTGAAGAPKLGDPSAWEARIAQGIETLYKHAIEGFQGKGGIMPPKGGRVDLNDDAIKAAVDYMIANGK